MANLLRKKQSRRQFVGYTALAAGGILLTSVDRAFSQQVSAGSDSDALDDRLVAFGQSMEGQLLLASQPGYEGIRRPGSFNPLTDKRPAMIARCLTSTDVARSIEFARANSLELAVRAGGHDVMGQSVCEGGVLIDLSLMRKIELDNEHRMVRVTAGVRCGEVDYLLSESGVIVPLSCHPGVGVSGLTLGGGLGWLLGRYGTSADNVTAMDVITADGRELRATEDQNIDLFWALRGGGGNFGIVTAFEYQVHSLQTVIGGFLVYPIETLGEYLRFYQDTMATAPDDLMIEISVAPTNPPLLIVTVCYSGSVGASQSVLAAVRKFGPPIFDGLHSTKLSQLTVPSEEAKSLMAAYSNHESGRLGDSDGYYNHWRGASISAWTDPAIHAFVGCVDRAPPGWSIGIGHYMHGAACTVEAQATPTIREEHSSSFFFNMSWGHSGQSAESMAWVDQSIRDMQPFKRAGTYVNYLSDNSPEAIADTYGVNYARLRQLKSRYDPDNIFHLNRNIKV